MCTYDDKLIDIDDNVRKGESMAQPKPVQKVNCVPMKGFEVLRDNSHNVSFFSESSHISNANSIIMSQRNDKTEAIVVNQQEGMEEKELNTEKQWNSFVKNYFPKGLVRFSARKQIINRLLSQTITKANKGEIRKYTEDVSVNIESPDYGMISVDIMGNAQEGISEVRLSQLECDWLLTVEAQGLLRPLQAVVKKIYTKPIH